MTSADAEPTREDDEPWEPPLWPRYVGLGMMAAIQVALIAFGVLAIRAMGDDDADGGQAFFGLLLAAVGTWYLIGQMRSAWHRLREARSPHE